MLPENQIRGVKIFTNIKCKAKCKLASLPDVKA